MIEFASGNLLETDAEALVNTVNCVGFMGKGIALQFKQAFPDNYDEYKKACRAGHVEPGRMFVYETRAMVNPKYIVNFPTKRHWRGKSRIDDIERGLVALVSEVQRLRIRSIAIPPLGCGLGGLRWDDIRPRIERAFSRLSDVHVFLFPPAGAPAASKMPVGTRPPNMTHARALLIKLMERYSELAYRLTLLEVQKLAYFLQEAGEPLRLQYEAGIYGPYARNLDKVLQTMEGHFTRGFGDSPKPDRDIILLPGAVEKSDVVLENAPESRDRLENVSRFIEGFETPYGMELLSSVHWNAWHHEPRALDAASAVSALHAWNARKSKMFQVSHIEIAWQRVDQWSRSLASPRPPAGTTSD